MLSLAFLAACTQEAEFVDNDDILAGEYEVLIAASQADDPAEPETRTELQNWKRVFWLPGDKISVFSAGQMGEFTSQNSESTASTFFKGRIVVDTQDLQSGGWITALYPYDPNATISGNVITTTLPSVQQAVAEGVADDLLATAARSRAPFILNGTIQFSVESSGMETSLFTIDDQGNLTEGELSSLPGQSGTGPAPEVAVKMRFDHLCSGLRFCLTKEGVESITLSSIGGEPLAGTFSFTWNYEGVPTVQSINDPSSSITLVAPEGGTFEPGVWYAFVTLPVVMNSGLAFTLEAGSKTGVREITSTINLARAMFSRCTNLDANVELEENEVEVQVAGPDTWVAIDELGRVMPTAITDDDVPAARDNRKVLMFYSSWHTDHQVTYSPVVNVTGIEWFYPEALTNPTHSAWGNSSNYTSDGSNNGKPAQLCFWGEPLFGYYRTTDPWVLRKHAEMLADAGVDAVVFDCTNGEFLWLSAVEQLLKTWSAAKKDGVKVPKIAFMLQLSVQKVNERNALRMLYYGYTDSSQYDNQSPLKGFYGRNEYSDLWFRLDGDTKPFIMAYPESLDLNDPSDRVIYNFFTWRPGQGDYVYGDHPDRYGNHQWGWLQDYPQNKFNEQNGETEQMTVGVAQNASDASGGHCFAINSPNTYGRSYTSTDKNRTLLVEATRPGEVASFKYGYNFQEQWDRALDVDPHYVFITQWNEWVALKMNQWPTVGASQGWYGSPNAPGYAFADQFDPERSRDIEPTANWGDNGDNYYYQLVKNVRQFKGVGSYPNVSRKMTMAIDGDFSGWEKVSPDFKHYAGNTLHRDHAGHSSLHYTNSSGRNDIVDARVTRDKDYIYFYVETANNITSRTNARWMRLLINIDRDASTGWKGYDFCLNYLNPTSDNVGIVSHSTGTGWGWENDPGETFDYAISGNKMEIRVARSVLGVAAGAPLDFEFKWADNNLEERMSDDPQVTRILSLYVDGDAAPGGRFNFHYKDTRN